MKKACFKNIFYHLLTFIVVMFSFQGTNLPTSQ